MERLSCDLETELNKKSKTFNWLIEQKQTSANFHWLSELGWKTTLSLVVSLVGIKRSFGLIIVN